ncbi:MAG TPA: hypothetical protein VF189_01255 [Patescibacteria group bacterium]
MTLSDLLKRYPPMNMEEILIELHEGKIPGVPEHLQRHNQPDALYEVYNIRDRVAEVSGRIRIAHYDPTQFNPHLIDGEESFHVKATQDKDPNHQQQLTVTHEGRRPRPSDFGR